MPSSSLVLAAIVFLGAVLTCGGTNPGARIALTENAFSKFIDGIIPSVAGQLQGQKFPDYKTSQSGFDIAITSITLKTFQIPDFQVSLGAGGVVQVSLHLDIMVTSNYEVSHSGFPPLHASGNINAGAANGHFAVTLTISDNGGHMEVSISGANTDVGPFTLQISGGLIQEVADIIVQIFNKFLRPPINNAINAALTGAANKAVERATTSYPEKVNIGGGNMISYSLTSNPDCTSQYFSIPVEGATSGPGGLIPPFSPSAMPVVVDSSHEFQIIFSDFLWDGLAYVYTQEKAFERDITSAQDPKLNTTMWSVLLPNIKTLCPAASCPMEIIEGILPNSAPSFRMSASHGMNLTAELQWQFVVDRPDGSKAAAFSLQVILELLAEVTIQNEKTIHLELHYLDVDFTITSSPIGPFSPSVINSEINRICNTVIVPMVNSLLVSGVAIPVVDGISFVNPEVLTGDGYLAIATDISYSP
eukprot:ANDGO_05466.mRNA.1 Putative BPI/LBP family protein At1g04970